MASVDLAGNSHSPKDANTLPATEEKHHAKNKGRNLTYGAQQFLTLRHYTSLIISVAPPQQFTADHI
ncbi:hypothetical protein CP97_03135 [Aurantiacibacter atlanticus]|uniref:Uncharacterized protein n=1 Tax=Aurantiacibacter atlanticus TaxID=1648404 RepID=A0A0H4VDT9_9SPHN|nr:hypothetical protein CP97_03135 [Aurantiacibacter atlanticus]